jgi:hypothetical protein
MASFDFVRALLVSVLLLVGGGAFAEDKDQTPPAEETSGSSFRWAPFPIVYYTPETSAALGAGLSFSWGKDNRMQPTNGNQASILGIGTFNGQAIAIVDVRNVVDERHLMILEHGTLVFPERFFGVGPRLALSDGELYTRNDVRFFPTYAYRFWESLWVGAKGFARWLRTNDAGTALSAELDGQNSAGWRFAVGPTLIWDSRDHINTPRNGIYFQNTLSGIFSPNRPALLEFESDLRAYYQLPWLQHILAAKLYMIQRSGDATLFDLTLPDIRGVLFAQLRDQAHITLEGEYRLPLIWRFGMTFFGGVANVASSLIDFDLSTTRWMIGSGLRFALIPANRLNVRFDVAYDGNESFIYFELNEAF